MLLRVWREIEGIRQRANNEVATHMFRDLAVLQGELRLDRETIKTWNKRASQLGDSLLQTATGPGAHPVDLGRESATCR